MGDVIRMFAVPDLKGFAAANGHDGRGDDEVRTAMGDKFPKHIYHSIVCIGALIAHQDGGEWTIDALGAPQSLSFCVMNREVHFAPLPFGSPATNRNGFPPINTRAANAPDRTSSIASGAVTTRVSSNHRRASAPVPDRP
jgi:hypothetical protein